MGECGQLGCCELSGAKQEQREILATHFENIQGYTQQHHYETQDHHDGHPHVEKL